VESPLERFVRPFFTVLALAVACLPLLALASNDSVRWGSVPEWSGASGLVFIAAGVWKIARTSEHARRESDTRVDADV